MEVDEKSELQEIDVDMDSEKKSRRSSILKPQKPRNPFSILDFSEANPDNTLARATRRVSFASSNLVKPFAADPEKNTIWDNTYEEEVNHTDSTKSDHSCPTKTSDFLNTTSVYSGILEYNEQIPVAAEYVNVDTEQVQILANSEESIISLVRKLRSRSVPELHNTNKVVDFSLINRSNVHTKTSHFEITNKENIISSQDVSLISSCSKLKNTICSTSKLSTCLTDKENVHPLINDISLITPKQNCSSTSETKCIVEADVHFTKSLETKEKTIFINTTESNLNFERNKSAIKLNPTVFEQLPLVEKSNNANIDDSINLMQFTSLDESDNSKQYKIESTVDKSKRKTIIINTTKGSTDNTITYSTGLGLKGNINTREISKNVSVLDEAANESRKKNKTVYFNESEEGMEFKATLPVKNLSDKVDDSHPRFHQAHKVPLLLKRENTINFDSGEDMEFTNTFPNRQGKICSDKTECKEELTNYDEIDDMEFTNVSIQNIIENSYQSVGNSHTKYMDDMELTTMNVEEDALKQSNISEDDMEFTDCFAAQRDGIKETKGEPNLKGTVLFDKPDCVMELINVVENKTHGSDNIRTFIQVEDMELTNMIPTQTFLESKTETEKRCNKIYEMDLATLPVNGNIPKDHDMSEKDMEFTNTLQIKIHTGVVESSNAKTVDISKHANIFPVQREINPKVDEVDLKGTILLDKSKCNMELTTTVAKIIDNSDTIPKLTSIKPPENTTDRKSKTFKKYVTKFAEEMTFPNNDNILQQSDMSLTKNLQTKDASHFSNVRTKNISINLDYKKASADSINNRSQIINKNISTEVIPDTSKCIDVCDINVKTGNSLCLKSNKPLCNNNSNISVNSIRLQEKVDDYGCIVNEVSNANNISISDITKDTNDIKRHLSDQLDGDIIKKRRIQEVFPQNKISISDNTLSSEFNAAKHSMAREKECIKTDKIDDEIDQVRSRLPETTFFKTASDAKILATLPSSNILYSEPMKVKLKTSAYLPIPDLSANLNLQSLEGSLHLQRISTPATSFLMGSLSTLSPCTEDTQQLIQATFSKPETLKILDNNRNQEPSDLLNKNTSSKLEETQPFVESSTQFFQNQKGKEVSACYNLDGNASQNLIKINEKTFTNESVKPILKNVELTHSYIEPEEQNLEFIKLCDASTKNEKSYFLEDTTPLALVPEEFDQSCLETELPVHNSLITNSNDFNVKLPLENIKTTKYSDSIRSTGTNANGFNDKSKLENVKITEFNDSINNSESNPNDFNDKSALENIKPSEYNDSVKRSGTSPNGFDDKSALKNINITKYNDSVRSSGTNSNGFNDETTSNIVKTTEYNDSVRNSASFDYSNYTLRMNMIFNNIEEHILPYEPMNCQNDSCVLKLAKQFRQNCQLLKDILSQPKKIRVTLEEKYKQEMAESLSSVNEATSDPEDLASSTSEFIVPKTLQEHICEISKRSKKYWEFVKMDDSYYYFYTLFGTLPFKVHVHPELGIVYSVETYTNLSDIVQPICQYELKLFQQKLKQENLLSVLGAKFDIFTLLDYIYMSMEEMINFQAEYTNLVKKYGESHHFRMNSDFSVTFEILNVKLIIFWIITVKMSITNLASVTIEDITAVHRVGQKVNEGLIKKIAENTPKGHHFLRSFVENVDEFANRIGRKIRN